MLTRLHGPAQPLLTAEELREYLRVVDQSEDALIESLSAAATEHVESKTRRALLAQTWLYTPDDFPCEGRDIALPRPPLQSVTAIRYRDREGDVRTMEPADYEVITAGPAGRIRLVGGGWPHGRDVEIEYVAGYESAGEVPETYKAAVRILVGHWYENREAVVIGTTTTQVPMGVEALLWPHRVLGFAE